MSQIVAMARRLQDAEQALADLKKEMEGRSSLPLPRYQDGAGEMAAKGSSESSVSEFPPHMRNSFAPSPEASSPKESPEHMLSDLSLDGHGKVRSR